MNSVKTGATNSDMDGIVVQVQWLSPDGTGGGKVGKHFFRVRGALPGDRIEVLASSRRGRTVEVESHRVVERTRASFPCPVVERCGGCDLAGLADRRAALERMVGVGTRSLGQAPTTWVDSPRQLGHRARLKLTVEDGRVGFRAARSHELVPIEACPAAREELQPLIGAVRSGSGRVELRTDGERVVVVADQPIDGVEHLAVDGRAVRGEPVLHLEVHGTRLRVSPRAFFQANLEVNRLLVGRVVQAMAGCERVLDLCAGIGNFSVPLARERSVVAVELEGQATADLRHNAVENGVQVEVHTGRVERFDPRRVAFDGVVLDPPRAGCKGVVDELVLQRPRVIAYVSCHLPSGVRDLKPALKAGYELREVVVFDMFPDTHHVETLLVLHRT